VEPLFITVAIGFLIGVMTGRWWGLSIPIALGMCWLLLLAASDNLDSPDEDAPGGPLGLVLIFTILALGGAVLGVAVRRLIRRS
jgi:hypothetical protein